MSQDLRFAIWAVLCAAGVFLFIAGLVNKNLALTAAGAWLASFEVGAMIWNRFGI